MDSQNFYEILRMTVDRMEREMKDPKGFLKIKRKTSVYRPVHERIKDHREVLVRRAEEHSKEQAVRCMDCGTPFCHFGCPLGNIIPEWNELLAKGHFKEAAQLLNSTTILPEVTGRICPALCESACVLGLNDDPITVRDNELAIIEKAFEAGYIKSEPPRARTGKKVGVIGSGPAGIAAAAHLNRLGHNVTLFEKDNRLGGILRYGIPDFKLEKQILDRRLDIFEKEGVVFKTGVNVGIDIKAAELKKEFDAICITTGSGVPRDLNIPGRDLDGVHFAMDFLIQSNKRVSQESFPGKDILAKDKNVVIIGGGDTGADCVGISLRQGAKSVKQIELLPKPPIVRTEAMPWPIHPRLLTKSSSHEEGGDREWSVLTEEFIGENSKVKALKCQKLEFGPDKNEKGIPIMHKIPNSGFEIPADLVILAMGFVHPIHEGLVKNLSLKLDDRGNIKTSDDLFATSSPGVFAAGDARRGASLIVWALYEGRVAAENINNYLKS